MKVIVASHPDEPRECQVEWVSPVLDSNTRSIRIRGSIDNHDRRLLADMYCSIILQIEDPTDSIILPGEAVVRKEDAAFVFVQKSSTGGVTSYERRPLSVEPIASGIGFETPATTNPSSAPTEPKEKELPKSVDGRRVRAEMVRVITGVQAGETVVVHNALGLFQEMEDRKEESAPAAQASSKAD
jgi:multidrug efflux pump subunit AcrA (membrane-fusion protein)